MFTGLVEAVGFVADSKISGRDRRIVFDAGPQVLKGVRIGDSIACAGICLTVARIKGRRFSADVSVETLRHTTAGAWIKATQVNLEKSLTLAQPLGGHLVSGHVDGVGRVTSRAKDARSVRLSFSMPRALARYVARKGSICVDGVSLTVNDAGAREFGVNIVPHTLRHTTLGRLHPGDAVNLEVDLLARYLERLNKT
jgi:riboflavin synthase